MSEPAEDTPEEPPKKKGGAKGLLIGAICAVLGAGGGYVAVDMGLLDAVLGSKEKGQDDPTKTATDARGGGNDTADSHGGGHDGKLAFVALDPIVVSLTGASQGKHLRFRAQLEVTPGFEAEVTALSPRIADVLNTYLRAVDLEDLTAGTELLRMRSHMLRRVRIVTGEGRVRDFLITEMVIT